MERGGVGRPIDAIGGDSHGGLVRARVRARVRVRVRG